MKFKLRDILPLMKDQGVCLVMNRVRKDDESYQIYAEDHRDLVIVTDMCEDLLKYIKDDLLDAEVTHIGETQTVRGGFFVTGVELKVPKEVADRYRNKMEV